MAETKTKAERTFTTSTGFTVVFKERLEWRESWEMTRAMTEVTGMPPVELAVRQLVCMIESWDLPGNPRDPDTWDKNMFREFTELFKATGEYYQQNVVDLGNSSES